MGVSFYELSQQCSLPHRTLNLCSALKGKLPAGVWGLKVNTETG